MKYKIHFNSMYNLDYSKFDKIKLILDKHAFHIHEWIKCEGRMDTHEVWGDLRYILKDELTLERTSIILETTLGDKLIFRREKSLSSQGSFEIYDMKYGE